MLKTLSDKRKYECQQRQNEYSKGHQVFKIKMFHQHHPPTQLNPYLTQCLHCLLKSHFLPLLYKVRGGNGILGGNASTELNMDLIEWGGDADETF